MHFPFSEYNFVVSTAGFALSESMNSPKRLLRGFWCASPRGRLSSLGLFPLFVCLPDFLGGNAEVLGLASLFRSF